MAAVGLAQVDGVLEGARLAELLRGYQEVAALTPAQLGLLAAEIEHAALIIAFHRYYRHSVRFPDPARSAYHLEMVRFVESIPAGVEHAA
ncbi:hypothetical protein ACFQLX_19685 [Streptomyces polyrhachis]|uniref:Uncharacterized protein n=1 Tax=Streptomyces polyrhachis TaxID=1282885 RepID=A0ABW2GL71_9ACTN